MKANQTNNRQPFAMLERVMLHHTPLRPSKVEDNRYAMGIRTAVKIMLTMEGGIVRPRPQKAPQVVISTHIRSWE